MIDFNFIKLYENSFQENWNLPAFTNLNEATTITYSQLAEKIAHLHILFEEMGIERDDKIALIGYNHTAWSMVFMATITYGAVIVPILHDFHSDCIENIVSHADTKLVFIDTNTIKSINRDNFTQPIITIPNWKIVNKRGSKTEKLKEVTNKKFAEKYPNGFKQSDIQYPHIHNDTVICLNYTSGTTGFIKGVMLTANNYAGNVMFAKSLNLLLRGESIVAFLPMAHAYGCTFDFLYALSVGVHIHLIGKRLSPSILFDALQKVKPQLIITVPLILERVYQKNILPFVSKPIIQRMLKTPILKKIVRRKIRKELSASFGGNFKEIIVGGAAMSKEAEAFLHKIGLPFTVGYGMTECAPLISYDKHQDFTPTSCGKVLNGIMELRINSEEPTKIPGEIQVRGENVMKGYYKNPRATEAAFTEDGWLRTGDLGILDNKNRLYIKGRIKTMILGANGQNIYPEEIEARLNNMPYVAESLIVKRRYKLVALVFPDTHKMEKTNVTFEQLESIMNNNLELLNEKLASFERIISIEIKKEKFQKTPQKSIKRYVYVED